MYLVVESYELTGRHTYFATAISAGCALVLLLSLATLHKNLAPKSKHNKDKDDDDLTISATCKLSFVVTESEIPGIITSVLGLMHMLYYNGCMLCPLRNGYSIHTSINVCCLCVMHACVHCTCTYKYTAVHVRTIRGWPFHMKIGFYM